MQSTASLPKDLFITNTPLSLGHLGYSCAHTNIPLNSKKPVFVNDLHECCLYSSDQCFFVNGLTYIITVNMDLINVVL